VCADLTVCSAEHAFESVAPTSSTDRECQALTICSRVLEYESVPASPTNDRVCQSLTACDYDTEYEQVPPTVSSDRVCAPIAHCLSSETRLAQLVEAEVAGDPGLVIRRAQSFDTAVEGDITYAATSNYLERLNSTDASAVIVSQLIPEANKALLLVSNPKLAFAKVLQLLSSKPFQASGISSRAFLVPSIRVLNFSPGDGVLPPCVITDLRLSSPSSLKSAISTM